MLYAGSAPRFEGRFRQDGVAYTIRAVIADWFAPA